ncbi:histidine kinase [Algoriphagus sp. AGSA1]|uniref:sensor histidine kinase n=1 Tax=Algoriphagus sp. AGSA1 TaxID=2907213 RepID=UPI001F34CDEE|nr:histidine kinase [Algoriphagus sp. AGSA1]MCE7055692.1 histidine kinase [Algoriphagus sp. AGSA1]
MEKTISFFLAIVLTCSLTLYLLYNGELLTWQGTISHKQWILLFMIIPVGLALSMGYLFIVRLQPWDKGHVMRSGFIILLIWGTLTSYSYLLEGMAQKAMGNVQDYASGDITLKGSVVAFIVSLIIVWIDYSWFSFARFSKETIQAMRVSRNKQELQFKLLRSQLTPHFLFNSLNSASNLITHQPQKAEEFIRKLAFNFTNLIKNGIQPLNTLEQEIEIIDNYMHLMQVRYGEKVVLEKRIKPEFVSKQIPALGIQLLVENALKHNVASLDNPVKIIITADQGQVVVANSITKKPLSVQSTGVGLNNLKERYLYHGNSAPSIYQLEGLYCVCLPYITQNTAKQ